MIAVLLAALSAVLYGTGVAFEHRQAAASPASAAGRPRLVLLLLRQPLWLVGAFCELAGFAAHSAALSFGSLACVQMILGGSLIVSVGLGSRLQKRRLTRRAVLAVVAVVIGVGATVALLGPHRHDHGADSGGRLVLATVITGLAAAPVVAAAFVTRGRSRPVLLGWAAGLSDAFLAVITMAFARVAGQGIGAVVTSWPTYALIAAGLASMVVTQTAFQADRPLVTLPLISAVTPLLSLVIGVTVLGETADLSPVGVAATAVCAALGVIGLITLARESARTTDASAPRVRTRATTGRTASEPFQQIVCDLPDHGVGGLVAAAAACGPDLAGPSDRPGVENAGAA
jgi:hypothetical protein